MLEFTQLNAEEAFLSIMSISAKNKKKLMTLMKMKMKMVSSR